MVRTKNSSSSSSSASASACPKEVLKRGAWTSQEDELLSDYISAHGLGRWRTLPANAGLNRCGKSCRLRWLNYLRPHIKRGNITEDEEELIIRLHKLLGNRWSLIAGRLPGRTDNEIKNYWNTHIRRKLLGCTSKNTTKTEQPSTPSPQVVVDQEAAAAAAEKADHVVNVIRTKAVRCTRTLVFADPLPASSEAENNISPPPPTDHSQLAADDMDHEPWMAEQLVQIPQLSCIDSPYTSNSDSLHNNNVGGATNDVSVIHEDDQYLGEWFGNTGILKEGEEGLYSLLDPDTWDSLTFTHKNIHSEHDLSG